MIAILRSIGIRLLSTFIPYNFRKLAFKAFRQTLNDDDILTKRNMFWYIANLKRLGFYPDTVIDVGAYKGTWTREVYRIFPDSKFLMIEAQESKEKDLSETAISHVKRSRKFIERKSQESVN